MNQGEMGLCTVAFMGMRKRMVTERGRGGTVTSKVCGGGAAACIGDDSDCGVGEVRTVRTTEMTFDQQIFINLRIIHSISRYLEDWDGRLRMRDGG